jgi:hypothetical protein
MPIQNHGGPQIDFGSLNNLLFNYNLFAMSRQLRPQRLNDEVESKPAQWGDNPAMFFD